MVTQDTAVIPKVNKMKMKKIKKKKSKKKAKGTENLDSESEADKLNLEQKMYPLSHYISDQEELVNHMFTTIRGSKLEAMLPPVLKSIPLKELKRLCLHELRGMSKKRILCCINGQVMEGSSGSEDEEDEKEEDVVKDLTKGEKRKPSDDQAPESYLLKKIKVEPGLEDSTGSGEGKSVLELLELEMRARIIKTMLEKGDEGKKITEDAIVAVMQSAKQITKGVEETGGENKEVSGAVAGSKDDSQEKEADREAGSDEVGLEERSRGRRSRGKEVDRRRRHHPARDGKRESSRRSQKRGDNSWNDEGGHGRSCKKQNESNNSEKQVMKRKKLTRKEFEERMKRAKKNRTYRQRKSSEDEEKTKEKEDKPEEENIKVDSEEKSEDKIDKKQDAPVEGKNIQDKTEGDVSEKEEGEIDSNEEEEGACSPSDISSASRCSSSTSCSRSWSRSYSRSLSRSPYRGRQRRSRRSRSRSRRRRRSYSRSNSRSRSSDRRRSRGEYQKRSFERKKSREPPKSNIKRDVKKTPPEDTSPNREEDWGHKCDIEFVDSEEDFDDHPEATKKDFGGQKTLPVNRTERASISFSLQKKSVGIAHSVDLDDLPLKKKQMNIMANDAETIAHVKPVGNEEIVISSDSEVESPVSIQGGLGKQKTLTESKAGGKTQTEKQPSVTSVTNSKADRSKKICLSSIKDNTDSQSGQEKEFVKVCCSETEIEAGTKGLQESTKVLPKLTTDADCEMNRQKESNDGTRITQNVCGNNNNREVEKEKYDVKNIDKGDSKEDSQDSKVNSRSKDDLEGTNVDCDSALEKGDVNRRDSDIIYEKSQLENKAELSSIDHTETFSNVSNENVKVRCNETLCEEKQKDGNSEAHTTGADVKGVPCNVSNIREQMTIDFRKSVTEREVNLKEETNIHSVEDGDHTEAEDLASKQTKGACSQKVEVDVKDGESFACSEREEETEKDDSLITSEQMEGGKNSKEVCSVDGDGSADFYRGATQLKLKKDENDLEGIDSKEFCKVRTPVESIRGETGLTLRHAHSSRKIEVVMPEKLWMKKGKRKREEAKDVSVVEGVGLLKSTLSESTPSSPQESEMETETSIRTTQLVDNEEVPAHSPVLASHPENTQPAQDASEHKQRSHSPKQDTLPAATLTEDKAQRRIDHDTEIIGVIETSKEPSDNFDDIELGGSSWSMRWLQSEKVQKVVTSSKMLSRVRKKIQRKEKATKVVMAEKVEEVQKSTEPVIPVIGSIEEYERLFGTKVKKDEAIGATGSAFQDNAGKGQEPGSSSQPQGDVPAAKDKGNPVFGSDDDGEDSEEEALWSKIIKK